MTHGLQRSACITESKSSGLPTAIFRPSRILPVRIRWCEGEGRVNRAVVWLADFWRGVFVEAQGCVGYGAVVVEAGVEAFEGFCVVKPQDGTSQQGKHLASAGFLARTRGVFFP